MCGASENARKPPRTGKEQMTESVAITAPLKTHAWMEVVAAFGLNNSD